MTGSESLFDEPFYRAINEARWRALQRLMQIVENQIGPIKDFNDLGAGPGWFAARLSETGRDVHGFEGRPELVSLARERVPAARFDVFDFDAASLDDTPPPADATLCFGLLYHLENPLRALRLCRAVTRHALFLESMTLPEEGALARLVPENPNQTQGIRPLAMLLSPDAIAHALRLAGFKRVYRMHGAGVEHDDFIDTPERRKRRDIFLAVDVAIEAPELTECNPAPLSRYKF